MTWGPMRRRVVVVSVSAFAVLACLAPLAFLRAQGGMRVLSPAWLVIGAVVLAASVSMAWILSPPGHPEKPRRGDRVRRLLAAPPLRIGAGLCNGLLFVLFMVAFTSALTGRSGSLLIAMLGQLPMGLMMAGISILGGAYLRRHGPPQCAGCHYDLSGAPDGGYDRCPECGSDARAPASIVRERREMHRGVLATGIVLAAAPFVWFFVVFRTPMLSHGWFLPGVPTGSLIAEVCGAPRGFTTAEWTELGTRALTPAQERALFEGLLGLRAERGFVDRMAEVFMQRSAESGAIPEILRDRYYTHMLEPTLESRPVPETGARVVTMTTRYRGPILATPVQAGFVVTGFEINGIAVIDDARMTGVGRSRSGFGVEAGTGPSVELRPQDWSAGDEVTVRVRGWRYALPVGAAAPEGTQPQFGAGTVWLAPLDLRTTVHRERGVVTR